MLWENGYRKDSMDDTGIGCVRFYKFRLYKLELNSIPRVYGRGVYDFATLKMLHVSIRFE